MRARTDPLVPLLGSAVTVVVLVAVIFIFYPRLSRWFGPSAEPVAGAHLSAGATVPIWVSRTDDGVALLLAPAGRAGIVGDALEGGPYHYLSLTVYNFQGEQVYELDLPRNGFASPEGGEQLRPAAAVLRGDAKDHEQVVMRGLGTVMRLEVEPGHSGKALFVMKADPARRTAFVGGNLRFERRELERQRLASWRQRPRWEQFKDF